MTGRAPRHGGEATPARRKQNARGMLAVLGFCALGALAIGSLLGTPLYEQRKARRREQAADVTEGPDAQPAERLPPSNPSG
ncbi:hypothetical protein GCM10011374_03010 [Kocuria dechangensis]|uniref:Uncharacterized protein n=1 Tax=Kocuria dechangensis TaxID=1176249 RepID=A0A917GG34_9MICC|nr:hypothetical protein GCM10011374_03010 [Kocuria dechangensis]